MKKRLPPLSPSSKLTDKDLDRILGNRKRYRAVFRQELRSASKCWVCGRKLRSEPRQQIRTVASEMRAFANVSFRCAYCLKTFCRTCGLLHFGPEPGATQTYKKAPR